MQIIFRIFSLVLLSIAALTYSGCRKDDLVKPVTDRQVKKLRGSWKATEVKADDALQAEYEDFILILSGKEKSTSLDYTIEGRPFVSPWPDSGVILFDDADPQHVLHRDDEVTVTYEVTGASLILSFNFSGEGYVNGRNASLTGEWVFKFTKQ